MTSFRVAVGAPLPPLSSPSGPISPTAAAAATAAAAVPGPAVFSTLIAPSATAQQMASRRGFSIPEPLVALSSREARSRGVEAGLRNAGNTCYVNAVLQALLGIRSFVHDLQTSSAALSGALEPNAGPRKRLRNNTSLAPPPSEYVEEQKAAAALPPADSAPVLPSPAAERFAHTFTHSLLGIADEMQSTSHGIIDAQRVKHLIAQRHRRFAGDTQQDAHEFLSQVLSQLDDDAAAMLLPQPALARGESGDSAGGLPSPSSQAAPLAAVSLAAASKLATLLRSSPDALQLQVDTLSPVQRNLHCEVELTLQCIKCGFVRTRTERMNDISLDLPDLRAAAPRAQKRNPMPNISPSLSPPISPSMAPTAAPAGPERAPSPALGAFVLGGDDPMRRAPSPAPAADVINISPVTSPVPGVAAKAVPPAARGKGGMYLASLSQLLAAFFRPQVISYRCDLPDCDGDEVRQTYTLKQLPRVLILHAKRFQPNFARGTYEKRTDRLRIDDTLDLTFACTTHTRKPPPIAALSCLPRTAPAAGLAPLFAASPSVTCKCAMRSSTESGGRRASLTQCVHSQSVLTEFNEIAEFIRMQHIAMQLSSSASSSSSASASGARKRKSSDSQAGGDAVHPLHPSASADLAETFNKKLRSEGWGSQNELAAVPHSPTAPLPETSSYFASSPSSFDGRQLALAHQLNALYTESRSLQQQVHELLLAANAAALAKSNIGLDASRQPKQQEQRLQQLVMRISEIEQEVVVRRAQQLEAQQMEARVRQAALARAQALASVPKGGSRQTMNSRVSTLDVSPPSPEPDLPPSSPAGTLAPGTVPRYELCAIIHHKGSIATSGHYITDLRLAQSNTSGAAGGRSPAQWARYDDQFVRMIDAQQMVATGERDGYLYLFEYQPAAFGEDAALDTEMQTQ